MDKRILLHIVRGIVKAVDTIILGVVLFGMMVIASMVGFTLAMEYYDEIVEVINALQMNGIMIS